MNDTNPKVNLKGPSNISYVLPFNKEPGTFCCSPK